ncbi:hypothetical protein OROMI_014896 [Orobanche minor]
MSPVEPMTLTEYEMGKLQNVKRNNEKLKELGVPALVVVVAAVATGSGTKNDQILETELTNIEMEEAEAEDTIKKKLESSEGLDGLDELVSGGKKSHGPAWLIGRHDAKCVTASTQASAPSPTNSYVQELTKKIRQEVIDEVEAKLNHKVYDEVDSKVNQKVQDNLTLVLVEANPTLNVNIREICATISSDTGGDGTPMTEGPSS